VPGVSVTVITRNERDNIAEALASARWADERIVVDAESTDDTAAIARDAGARVEVRPWPGYGPQKNFAASLARNDWILSIDADERVTPELAASIRATLATEPEAAAYRVARIAHYLGRWIRSTDFYPDYQLRLYDRRRAAWNERLVHERLEPRGRVGLLRGYLQHHPYRDISHHLATIDKYTTLAAEQLHADGRRTYYADLLLHPPAAFLRNYLLRLGIRDGFPGLVISGLNSYYVYLKFVKLWDLQQRRAGRAR
jgi:glycosyltransferase involved in cell wall biosynthesis